MRNRHRKCASYASSSLRNAFGHGNYRVDPGSQRTHVTERDGSIDPGNDAWLLAMMRQRIAMLRELPVLREVIYVLETEDEAGREDALFAPGYDRHMGCSAKVRQR